MKILKINDDNTANLMIEKNGKIYNVPIQKASFNFLAQDISKPFSETDIDYEEMVKNAEKLLEKHGCNFQGEIINKRISGFRNEYFFLSNFYKSPFMYKGIMYSCAESAFQAQKCKTDKEKREFSTLEPKEAKRRGRKVKINIKEWDDKKDSIMWDIVFTKFSTNNYLKNKLLETKNRYLCESNYWHDNHFGDCQCKYCENIEGENILGKILMDIRAKLY